MNRVKVVGIVLKIYWYPLWLESHMSMCVFYALWHSHYDAPLHCLSFFLSYSNAHMDYLHSTEMRWFIRLSFPGWIHTHKFECMLYFRLVLCYCVYCICFFVQHSPRLYPVNHPGYSWWYPFECAKFMGFLCDHMYAFKLTPPSQWMKKK